MAEYVGNASSDSPSKNGISGARHSSLPANIFPSFSQLTELEEHLQLPDSEEAQDLEEVPENFAAGPRAVDFDAKNLEFGDFGDDSSSLASVSSAESMESLPLLEKREKNLERNAQRHRELFGDQSKKSNAKKRKTLGRKKEELDADIPESKPRGMLMKKTALSLQESQGIKEHMVELLERYPHRGRQIQQLISLFRATIGQASHDSRTTSVFVPAPVFVLGNSGTGKTSVVRAALEAACQNKEGAASAGSAYVNCHTLEPSTIGRLVTSMYNQLQPDEYRDQIRQKRRQSRRKKVFSLTDQSAEPRPLEQDSSISAGPSADKAARPFGSKSQGPNLNETNMKVQERMRRVQPIRAAKHTSHDSRMPATEATSKKGEEGKLGHSLEASDAVENLSSVVVALGRSLQPFYGVHANRCGFAILDQGPERLLSLSATNSKNEKTNILAELLLLPKVMRLNLTFIIIATNCTLHESRLNNARGSGKSLATISSGLHPVLVQFPAYKGNGCFLEILRTQQVQELIIGRYSFALPDRKSFFCKLVDSFFGSLVQFLADSTRDMGNFVRIGRALWPVFVAPLHPDRFGASISSIKGKSGASSNLTNASEEEAMVLTHLGQKFLQYTATISGDDITGLLLGASLTKLASTPQRQKDMKLPYIQSCLLLAAFICQHNRTDQDRKVFAAEGNGRRSKRNRQNMHQGDDEHVAFSASAIDLKELQSLRPRPFQLERALSIFVTLVRLNPNKLGNFDDLSDEELQNLGSSRLHDDLAQLVDLGYLHATNFTGSLKTERINLDGTKIWCSLTQEEALHIAKRIAIPLDNYIV